MKPTNGMSVNNPNMQMTTPKRCERKRALSGGTRNQPSVPTRRAMASRVVVKLPFARLASPVLDVTRMRPLTFGNSRLSTVRS